MSQNEKSSPWKSIFIAGVVIILVVVGIGFIFNYVEKTYIGTDYYAVVKAPLPKKQTIDDDSGKSMGEGYVYRLDAFDSSGKEKLINKQIVTDGSYADGTKPYTEGTILKIKSSDTRDDLETTVIDKNQVPDSVKGNLGISG